MNGETRAAFIERQAALLASQGHSPAEIRSRLADQFGSAGEAVAVEAVGPLVAGFLEGVGLTEEQRTTVAAGLRARLHTGAEHFVQGLRVLEAGQVYALAVGALITLVTLLWKIQIQPAFEAAYGFSNQLPAMTQWVLSPPALIVGLGLVWAVVLLFFATDRSLRRLVREQQVPPRALGRVPGLGRLQGVYADWLAVRIIQSLEETGADVDDSVHSIPAWKTRHGFAAQAVRDPEHVQLGEALAAAASLGTLSRELAYQAETIEADFAIRAAKLREGLMFTLLVTFGLVAGTLLVAMYLPIFMFARIF